MFSLGLHLNRYQSTLSIGCYFTEYQDTEYEPPNPYAVIFNELYLEDGGFWLGVPSPSSDSELLYLAPMEFDEVPGGFSPEARRWALGRWFVRRSPRFVVFTRTPLPSISDQTST